MANLEQLLKQQSELAKQIEETRASQRQSAIDQIKELMAAHQLRPEDLGGTATRKKGATGKKVAAKYRDPSTGDSWSGRGLQPKWLKAALSGGKKKLTDFAL